MIKIPPSLNDATLTLLPRHSRSGGEASWPSQKKLKKLKKLKISFLVQIKQYDVIELYFSSLSASDTQRTPRTPKWNDFYYSEAANYECAIGLVIACHLLAGAGGFPPDSPENAVTLGGSHGPTSVFIFYNWTNALRGSPLECCPFVFARIPDGEDWLVRPPLEVSFGRLYPKYSIAWLDYQYQCNNDTDMILSLLPRRGLHY